MTNLFEKECHLMPSRVLRKELRKGRAAGLVVQAPAREIVRLERFDLLEHGVDA